MPLSIKYKCVFIHIPRTGGTSFRKILGIDGDGVETTGWSKASLEQVNGKGLLSISNREVTQPSHTIPRELYKPDQIQIWKLRLHSLYKDCKKQS